MNKKPYSVAVVGLGSMGMGAAISCIRAGLDTYGVDINPDVLERLKSVGAKGVSHDLSDFTEQIDAILLLVVNADQIKKILFSNPALSNKLKKDTAVMLSSTMSPEDSIEISQKLTEMGMLVLDAPVSGGAIKAEQGEMSIMASGSQDAFDRLKPVLNAISSKVYPIGNEIGLGSTVKVIHQLLAGVHIAAAAEAMAMAAKAHIPLDLMYQVVTNAAGNSWMFENRMKHVLENDYRPLSNVDIFVKDLSLVQQTAKKLNFPLYLANNALAMFTQASNAGYGKLDDSAVIKIFQGLNLTTEGDKKC